MPEQEKDKQGAAVLPADGVNVPAPRSGPAVEEDTSQYFFGEQLVGFDPSEISGHLVVIEGMDGSGRSTQIALLQEWLESEGFAVETSGLGRGKLGGGGLGELGGET